MHVGNSVTFRENSIKIILTLFTKELENEKDSVDGTRSSMDINYLQSVANNIETGIYNFALREADSRKVVKKWEDKFFVTIYTSRLRALFHNISNCADFRNQVLSGSISPLDLSKMSHFDFQPGHWKELLELKRRKDASMYNTKEQPSTDMFKCIRCNSRRCQHFELQVRSADESCSVWINCLDCGKRWRVN